MTAAVAEFKSDEAGRQLMQLLQDGTDALAQLDVDSLELLQERAIQVKRRLERRAMVQDELLEPLASRRRVFAQVLRSTGEHVNLLRRMNGRIGGQSAGRTGNGVSPWDR